MQHNLKLSSVIPYLDILGPGRPDGGRDHPDALRDRSGHLGSLRLGFFMRPLCGLSVDFEIEMTAVTIGYRDLSCLKSLDTLTLVFSDNFPFP